MSVWIFVINALFTPVVAPLGVSIEEVARASMTAPATAEADDPSVVAASITTEPRFHGIERLLAPLEDAQ